MRMTKLLIVVLVIIPFSISNADSATQTDWSGGPGILGPVLELGIEFYLDTDVNWSSNPGDIVLQLIAENTVDAEFYGAMSVYSEDIDGDGYMDILGAAQTDDDITWWENIDGSGTSWTEHTVDGNFDGATSVYSEDIDGDGDMDMLGAAVVADDITWWENINGSGTSWAEHTVDGDFDGAKIVYSEDIDGDGDMDILGAAYNDDDITWWENEDGSGISWIEHTVDEWFGGANCVYSEDLDDDGDMDVLGAAKIDGDITWWENINGSGTSWAEHTVNGNFAGAISVYSEDIDGDGDMDILGAANFLHDITWWENIDGSGISWVKHTVDEDFWGAISVYSEDIDGDGDMDILGAAYYNRDITWWENENGSGINWIKHNLDGYFDGASSVYSKDIDGDGDMDILGSVYFNSDITWWDLTGFSHGGSLESSIFDTQGDPDWDYLEWNSQTPSGTFISFQVRASDDHTVMGAWSDTLTSPCQLASILNDGDRYVQYRTILETSSPDSTPTLNDVTITWDPLGIGETVELIPTGTELFPIAPNPSAGSPIIRFGLLVPASVEIFIFDLSGRLVSEIHGDEYSAGYHSELIDDLFQGTYFCRMTSGDFTATQRFVVIE